MKVEHENDFSFLRILLYLQKVCSAIITHVITPFCTTRNDVELIPAFLTA